MCDKEYLFTGVDYAHFMGLEYRYHEVLEKKIHERLGITVGGFLCTGNPGGIV